MIGFALIRFKDKRIQRLLCTGNWNKYAARCQYWLRTGVYGFRRHLLLQLPDRLQLARLKCKTLPAGSGMEQAALWGPDNDVSGNDWNRTGLVDYTEDGFL